MESKRLSVNRSGSQWASAFMYSYPRSPIAGRCGGGSTAGIVVYPSAWDVPRQSPMMHSCDPPLLRGCSDTCRYQIPSA